MGRWSKYFKVHRNSDQHEIITHVCAIFFVEETLDKRKDIKTALDLGCGTGRDTLYLLKQGFNVTAIDAEAEAIEIIKERCLALDLPKVTLRISTLETIELAEEYDLISSNLTLPFISPENFKNVWSKIVQHIKFEGRFSGQFFGIKHEWSNFKDMTFFSYYEIKSLFGSLFQIEVMAEVASKTKTVSEGEKFWHQWDVIARKKAINPEKPIKNKFLMFDKNNCRKNVEYNENGHEKSIYPGLKPGFLK